MVVGREVDIGAFVVIEAGAELGDGVYVSHHCVVGYGAMIGAGTRLVQPVRVDAFARVGKDCIVGGNIPDRAVLGDRVTSCPTVTIERTSLGGAWTKYPRSSRRVRSWRKASKSSAAS